MNRGYKRLSRQLGLAIMLLAAPIFILSLGLLFEQSRTLIHHEVSDYISSTLNTAVQRVCYYMNTVETDAKPTNFRHMANMLSEGEQPYLHAYYVLLDGDGISVGAASATTCATAKCPAPTGVWHWSVPKTKR